MPENNKVMYDGQVVMDISDSTVSADNMLQGVVGYSGAGVRTVGALNPVKWEEENAIGGKNYISIPYYDGTSKNPTGSNMYFSVQRDGSIIAYGDGTAASQNYTFYLKNITRSADGMRNALVLQPGTYIANGIPEGCEMTIYRYGSQSGTSYTTVTSSGKTFTVDGDYYGADWHCGVYIQVKSGTILPPYADPIVFKPMIRRAEILNDVYSGYGATNELLTAEKADLRLFAKPWVSNMNWTVGEHVYYKGKLYKCLQSHSSFYTPDSSSASSYWREDPQLMTMLGHELVNSSGSTMTQRSKMEFLDTHLTDDSANNTTKVQVVKEVTYAQFANETEQGLYRITDKPDSVINAEQVAYGSGNVEQALEETPTDISDKFVLNTTQFSSLRGTCKAFYDKKTKRVWGTLSADSTENIGQTQGYFTIASDYRPSANVSNIPMQVRMSDDRMICYFGNITTGGLVRQDLTSASRGIYAYFEYYL